MNNNSLKIAIFTHRDTMTEVTEALAVSMAQKSPGVLRVIVDRVEGILQLTIYYEETPFGLYELAGKLQDPNGAFSELRAPEEIEKKLGPTGKILERTRRGFGMLINTTLEDALRIQKREQEWIDVSQMTSTEIKRWKKAEKIKKGLNRVKILHPNQLETTVETIAA